MQTQLDFFLKLLINKHTEESSDMPLCEDLSKFIILINV